MSYPFKPGDIEYNQEDRIAAKFPNYHLRPDDPNYCHADAVASRGLGVDADGWPIQTKEDMDSYYAEIAWVFSEYW